MVKLFFAISRLGFSGFAEKGRGYWGELVFLVFFIF
jgi:hypothetical protein